MQGILLFIPFIPFEMKNYLFSVILLSTFSQSFPQIEFEDVYVESTIDNVQPMTGIVFWDDSDNNNTGVISLEFSYMLFNKVVTDSGIYNWDAVESKLNAIAGRNHQAIFRFRYVYPGYKTSVPDYILNRDDYHETIGVSEGKETHFPDWENEELQRFTLEFYTKFAGRYDNDPRLAFIQVGFGLWAEYHIYDGPFILGKTFPGKAFQEAFFYHLDSTFKNIPWNISVDAADDTYTPFVAKPELKNIKFGLFDDSFMHKDHSSWNELEWNFFDRERYKISPAGGEFSYYSNYDQAHVLDYPDGPYGTPFETWALNFHITYMIGNDQPSYQTMERIKEASMATGYKFKIVSIRSAPDTSVFEILNYGVAPVYYDAYLAVDGMRAAESLKLLAPGETRTCAVSANAKNAKITIECDKLVPGQKIEYFGTQELPSSTKNETEQHSSGYIYPNPVKTGTNVYLGGITDSRSVKYRIYNSRGNLEISSWLSQDAPKINTSNLDRGVYLIQIEQNDKVQTKELLVL
jgi:hypothetical protein